MIKTIFQTAVGSFLGVVLGALLGILWLMREMKKIFEEKSPSRKSSVSYYSKFYRDESAKNKDYKFNSRDVVFPSREEADEALDILKNEIDDWDVASVSDLYNLVGTESTYQDENYGWHSLVSAYIQKVRNGYVLVLPRPNRLNIA